MLVCVVTAPGFCIRLVAASCYDLCALLSNVVLQ